jgi:hypothetical protein
MSSYNRIHEWQTRLVLIKPNADLSAFLELSLVVVDIVDLNTGAVINHETLVTYDALSYAWGTVLPTIECICDRHMILLRDNLAAALRFLRRPEEERYVWADFQCINQEDDVEKAVQIQAVQIPRMKSIYAKASTVVIWLGESPAIDRISQHCRETCGSEIDILDCPNHLEEVWRSILEYSWFERTWVRQEVFAAKKLDVCSPYFSTSWESFNEALGTVQTSIHASDEKATRNLTALNRLYTAPPSADLASLLTQARGFRVSVPHDHVFSVLGMMYTPKNDASSFPVTYEKSYDEICADVTKFIIRNTRNVSILRWCPLQKEKSYAFNWPIVETSCQLDGRKHVVHLKPNGGSSEFLEWFHEENHIRQVGTMLMKSLAPFSTWGSLSSSRPLVLYGRAWGILTHIPDLHVWFKGYPYSNSREEPLPPNITAYSAEDEPDEDGRTESPPQEHLDGYRESVIFKRGLVRGTLNRIDQEHETIVQWTCYGSVRAGDMFVSLEPGPCDFVLRKCAASSEKFTVVAWSREIRPTSSIRNGIFWVPTKDDAAYYLAAVETHEEGWWFFPQANDPPGPRELFHIQ